MKQPHDLESYLIFAEKRAREAGKIMLKYFGTAMQQREKEDLTLVTVADEEINALLLREIDEAYPSHSFFGEEGSKDKNSQYCWVCDPIDGTVPFAKGLAISVFSLAFVQDGTPLVGVVYDPFTDRMYSGIKGGGAFMNGSPLRVSSLALSHSATIDVEWWPEAPYDVDTPLHHLSKETGVYVLHLGSVIHAACLVAAGGYEACVFAGAKGKNIDMAAVKVIVEEAGGQVTNLAGKDQRYDQDISGAILSNGIIHKQLVEKLTLN